MNQYIIQNIKLSFEISKDEAFAVAKHRLLKFFPKKSIGDMKIYKTSVDARKKENICFVYSVSAEVHSSARVDEKILAKEGIVPLKEEEMTIEDIPAVELPTEHVPPRTPEQESLDSELIMLLREQLAGAYPISDATFTYIYNETIDGRECFVYEMKNGEVTESFAVSTDSAAIYHLEEEGFVSIFDI